MDMKQRAMSVPIVRTVGHPTDGRTYITGYRISGDGVVRACRLYAADSEHGPQWRMSETGKHVKVDTEHGDYFTSELRAHDIASMRANETWLHHARLAENAHDRAVKARSALLACRKRLGIV